MYDSNRSRRAFLRYLSTVALTAVAGPILPSCTGSKGKSRKLRLYGTGTLDILDAGWAVLHAATGVELTFQDNGNDTGPVIAQMVSGTAAKDYDLGGLQGGAERELAKAGTILPWDLDKIPNWETMWPMATAIPYAQVDGRQFGLPIALNADSIVYLPERMKAVSGYESGVVDSYFAIFDEKMRGRVSMEDAWINSVIFTAIYLKANGLQAIGDPGDLTEDELEAVMMFLIEKKRGGQFRKFWRGWEQGVELLESGEVWAMTGWEPIVYELRRRGIAAEYAKPKEGYEGWSNDLLLHAGTKEKGLVDAAHEVADWLLGGHYGCALATLRGYAVPNDTTVAYAKKSADFNNGEIEKLSSHVKEKFGAGGGEYWQNVRPRNFRLYEEWWSRLRNA